MKAHFISRIELTFWDFAIQALSQSNLTRTSLRKAYELSRGPRLISLGLLMAFTGFAGLLSGSLFYVLTSGLR